jgi:tetratricopeptide (TPR) repeat protein
VEEFKRALRLRSNYPEARQKLMEAQAKASEQPSPAPPTSPGESSTLLSAGRAAYDRGDWDEAIAKLEALQSADPNYEQAAVQRLLAAAYEYSGLELINEGSMEEAIRRFNQALALEPDNPDIQLQSRLATLYQGGVSTWGVDWNQTIKSLAAVYALKPDYVDIAERLLKAYVEAGNAAGAGAAWCDAVEYYKLALDLSSTPELAAKRDDAAHRCASGEGPAGGTPVPTGTYVGTFAGLVDNRKRTTDWAEVRGHVRNASGQGVANAQVKVSAFDWSAVHTTDGNGYYSVEFLNHEITFTVSLVGLPVQPVDVPTRFGYAAVADFVERK